jgi:large subunit ribosomal protein L18
VAKIDKNAARKKRHFRIRKKISGTAERPRLNVFKSNKYFYAQVIDDTTGNTIVLTVILKQLKK